MSAVYAMFDDGVAAQRAVNGLRQSGLSDSQITIISAVPIEDQEFSDVDKATWIWYLATFGGFVGLGLSTWLIVFTETTWPMNVGNMPVVAWWPNLIVMFEMTMLGAILTAVGTLVVTAALGRKMPPLYDPEVSDGKILVGVAAPSEASVPDLERALRAAGAAQHRRVECPLSCSVRLQANVEIWLTPKICTPLHSRPWRFRFGRLSAVRLA